MSLSQAIRSALSGLSATQVQASVVSRNVANAQTEGYARKDIALVPLVVAGSGAGVSVSEITRTVDQYLIRDMRRSAAQAERQNVIASALSGVTDLIGQPQDERSLATLLGNLDRSLISLANAPEDDTRQRQVVSEAQTLVSGLRDIDRAIRVTRQDADAKIAALVANVNETLQQIHDLNDQISGQVDGRDIGDLLDSRDRLLDRLSENLPLTVITSGTDVTIMTESGTTLLDSEVHPLSFSPSATIPAGAAYVPPPAASPLSGLIVDGIDISPSSGYAGSIREGALAGLFEIRDQHMPRFQAQIDEIAAQLAGGFQAADATVTGIAPNDTGLFTDAGAAVNPLAYPPGLAGRLNVNALVVPETGGDPALLRDGLHATASLPQGDPTQILAFGGIFQQTFTFNSATTGLAAAAKLIDFAASAATDAQSARSGAENRASSTWLSYQTYASSRTNQDGVNVDDEMQKMTLIERSYAANAQVISIVNQMLDDLLASIR